MKLTQKQQWVYDEMLRIKNFTHNRYYPYNKRDRNWCEQLKEKGLVNGDWLSGYWAK